MAGTAGGSGLTSVDAIAGGLEDGDGATAVGFTYCRHLAGSRSGLLR